MLDDRNVNNIITNIVSTTFRLLCTVHLNLSNAFRDILLFNNIPDIDFRFMNEEKPRD